MSSAEQIEDITRRAEILFAHAGKKPPGDNALQMFVEDAIQDALIFCNREEMPPEANKTLARMAYLASTGLTIGTDLNAAPVTSVTEEGRTVAFATAAQIQVAAKETVSDIEKQLSRFKQLYSFSR